MKRLFFLKWPQLLQGLGLRRVPDSTPAKVSGRYGERFAAKWLRQKGYTLLSANWRYGRDEIDLVCRDKHVVVFVEVKTRREGSLVSAFYSVTRKKKKALRRVCTAYLRHLKRPPQHVRFDIVTVTLKETGDPVVGHYENVLLFPKCFHCS